MPSSSSPVNRVVIIDDDEIYCVALGEYLNRKENIDIVGTALNSTDGLRLVESKKPDLAIVDIWLRKSDLDGVEVAREIKERFPQTRILLMTNDTKRYADQALELDVNYLTKEVELDVLLLVISRILTRDGSWVDPDELKWLSKRKEEFKKRGFTKMELKILARINRPDSEICDELGLTEENLRRNHLHNIYRKIGVGSKMQRLEAINYARKWKYLIDEMKKDDN